MDFIQRKTNLTKEEIRNHVVIFTNTSKYLLEARSLTKPLELADKIHDLMNLKVPHDSIESKIMEMFILTPMLENIQVLKKELNFAKYNKRNISPWYILIIVLVFSVIVCNLFAKWIAPEKNTINPDEIERMKRTIKEQNETIADHKAEMSKNRILMCAQNDQMDYLDSTIRDQEAYIQKLEEQINNNDTKITAPE
jgi:hypothetical protein